MEEDGIAGADAPARKLLTVEVAARYLSISARHLWAITDRGDLTSIKVGNCVRYSVEDLDAYIASSRRPVKKRDMKGRCDGKHLE